MAGILFIRDAPSASHDRRCMGGDDDSSIENKEHSSVFIVRNCNWNFKFAYLHIRPVMIRRTQWKTY
jgi:hypothetical protein